jgi:Xaa-Pro aminopeptidase
MMSPSETRSGRPAVDHAAIRRDRITTLLPRIMREQSTDAWLTFTRENTPDPILPVFGIEHIVARGAFLFAHQDGAFRRVAIAASYDVEPIRKTGLFEEVIAYKSEGVKPHLKRLVEALAPRALAVNMSRDVTIADGLTCGLRGYLAESLGDQAVARFTSSEKVVVSLLARKLPMEIAALEEAVRVTQKVIGSALTPERIKPGTTTERALGDWMAASARDMGCPLAFECVVVGPVRGHSEPSDRVIQHGDVVRIDWGASYEGYCADIQRMAYVRKPGEKGAPAWVERLFAATLKANRAAIAALVPGNTGHDVDTAGRSSLVADGFDEYPHGTGHPIGLKVHDVGPLLGPDWRERYGDQVFFKIESDQVYAVEPLIYAKPAEIDYEVNSSIEENVVVTPSGPRVLGTPQTALLLI